MSKKIPLISVTEIHPNIILDIRYATTDNFTHKIIYPFAFCLVHQDLAEPLNQIQQDLERDGFGLKIFDGYRPLVAQQAFWELLPDERYIGNPAKKPRHSRGTAVDVTLVNKHGNELIMPTEFDSFSERAHLNFMDLPEEILQNRAFLQKVMEKHGFTSLDTEWWHFDLKNYCDYESLDLTYEDLHGLISGIA